MTFPGANRRDGLIQEEGGCSDACLSASGASASDPGLSPEADKEPAVRQLSSGDQQRAQRYPIQTRLRYRTTGNGEWHEGRTVNISESGVLFQTDHLAWSNTKVEMVFSLPTEPVAQVACRGVIARTVSEPGSPLPTALAARITKFRLARPGRGPVG